MATLHTGLVPSGIVVDPGPEAAALRRAANRLYGIDAECARFPAVMPQSIDDTNSAQMHKAPYVAMEKTDGVHYVLLMTRLAGKPIAVMFGRSGTMFRVNMPAVSPYYKGTLLEGELVKWVPPRTPAATATAATTVAGRGKKRGREDVETATSHRALRFVVFEAVALRGVDLRKLPFVDRINAARFVAEPEGGADLSVDALAARVAGGKLTLVHTDMWLDAKRPRAVKDAVAIAQANTQPCDGIVFMPNVAFRQCGRRWAVLKKKFCDTLDFVVRVEKKADTSTNISILYTCGEDLLDVFTSLKYAGRDVQFVLKTRSRALKTYLQEVTSHLAIETSHEQVCEFVLTKPAALPDAPPRDILRHQDRVVRDFGYVVNARFVKPRPDKLYPNTLSTITRTFLGMSTTLDDVVRRATGTV